MSENTKDFGLFIDGLRLDRNISREELIVDIVSLSQYKRYLRGVTPIPNTILIQLADRLKFNLAGLYRMFELKQDIQNRQILNIYSLMRSTQINEAYNLAKKMTTEIIISDYNKLFFDYCFIYVQHKLNMVSDIHALGMYSDLVNYPKCISNETFNWVEINILLEIVKVSAKIENFTPSKHLYNIITSPTFKFISVGYVNFIPSVFAKIAPVLGMQNMNEEVINLTNEGIEYCKKHQVSSALASLYISKTYALVALERNGEAIECAKRALMQLYLEDNTKKYQFYEDALVKTLEIEVDLIRVK